MRKYMMEVGNLLLLIRYQVLVGKTIAYPGNPIENPRFFSGSPLR